MRTPRPHRCSICSRTFARSEHLHRHMRLHTGEKLYQCPCGDTFSRSDLLARHLHGCDKGCDSQERVPKAAQGKKPRAKRACDRCAQSKLKCDGQDPCHRCSRQSFACRYTREGSHDLYGAYSISHSRAKSTAFSRHQLSALGASWPDLDLDQEHVHASSPSGRNLPKATILEIDSLQLQEGTTSIGPSSCQTLQSYQLPLDQDLSFPADLDIATMSFDYTIASIPGWIEQFTFSTPSDTCSSTALEGEHSLMNLPLNVAEGPLAIDGIIQPPDPSFYGPFSLEQMDPVEAKCEEIRALLAGSEPLVTPHMISSYVTRENLLYSCRLYGKDFRHHYPVVHVPTFNLIDASPFLLLAIMMVSACYSKEIIPPDYITKFAMRLLKLIENQPHEIQMDAPPLPTIQASAMVCSILFRSRSETACKFVFSYFARNISLISRTSVFDKVSLVDYKYVTEQTFDWQDWVYQESLRRSLFKILCQDIAGCIFQGSSPRMSPLDLDVQLPCYECAWEAKTASECLRQLQSMPPPMHLSDAMRRLRAADKPALEASGLGMIVLITGLHYLLFQATKYDAVFSFGKAESSAAKHYRAQSQEPADVDSRLQQDLSGPTIAALADKSVASGSFLALKHVNNALNSWRTTWDSRVFRETWCENSTFFGDPLPFWWLAKLYIFLHCYAPLISHDSEFATPRVENESDRDKMLIQAKIIRWFSRFQTPRHCIEQELYDAVEP